MKGYMPEKTILAAGVLVIALLFAAGPLTAFADTGKADEGAEKRRQEETAKKRKEVVSEAASALRETQNALKALDEEKSGEALASLERAMGKLEIILARDPELALAPANVNTITYDVLADKEAVESLSEEAEDALEDGRLQKARRLIRNLASETVIRTSNIPLATYPDAIRRAVKHIDEGKTDKAKNVLQTALNTLVVKDTIIPLPVVAAQNLLKEAETLTEKKDRGKDEDKRLKKLLSDARRELEFAEALGYGSEEDFENLYEELDRIEERTEDSGSGSGFFSKIKGYLEDTFRSSQSEMRSGESGQ